MTRRTSLILASLAALMLGLGLAGTASANCGADHEAMSSPDTTASSTPTQQHQQAPGTNG
ncbi:MAG TPA: hypothetical protein VKY65_18040 [Alphaproteobacteria bacterium]|nr:hypothetical protein [Alphaproteobacteria bacterium]